MKRWATLSFIAGVLVLGVRSVVPGQPLAEAAVTLVSFIASPQADKVSLTWRTASEVNTVGYNLYRAPSEQGTYTKVNPALIPSSGGPVTGGNYAYADSGANNKAAYYYRLEEVEVNSSSKIVATASVSPAGSAQDGATATPTSTATPPPPTPTATAAPTSTPTARPTATNTPRPAPAATATPTRTPQPAPTATPHPSATPTLSPTATPAAAPAVSTAAPAQASPTPAVPPARSPTPMLPTQTPSPRQPSTATPLAASNSSPGPTATAPAAAPAQTAAPLPSLAAASTISGELPKGQKATAIETLPLASGTEGRSAGLLESLSPVQISVGGLFVLGMIGVLSSVVWGLIGYRRR